MGPATRFWSMQPYSVPVRAMARAWPMTEASPARLRNMATWAMSVAISPKPGPNLARVPKRCLPCLWRSTMDSISMRRIRSMISGSVPSMVSCKSAAEKRIGGLAGDRFQGKHTVAPRGFGVLHHLLDDVLDVGFLVHRPFFDVGDDAGDRMQRHREHGRAERTAEHQEHFRRLEVGANAPSEA